MKKLLIAGLLGLFAHGAIAGEVIRTVTVPTTGTTTAIGTLTGRAQYVTYPLAVYQVVDTETNTVTMTKLIYGATDTYAAGTLSAVTDSTGVETIGAGDVTADVDDIILSGEDQLILTGAGAAASNVVYRVLLLEVSRGK